MSLRAHEDPSRTERIETLPLEFYGVSAGEDTHNGNSVYSIIFMAQGAKPEEVPDDQLLQILCNHKQASLLFTALQSILMSHPGK